MDFLLLFYHYFRAVRSTWVLIYLAQEHHTAGVITINTISLNFNVEGRASLEGVKLKAVNGGQFTELDCGIKLCFRHKFVAFPKLQGSETHRTLTTRRNYR